MINQNEYIQNNDIIEYWVLEGHIIICTGEVRNNWLNTIRNIPKADATVRIISISSSQRVCMRFTIIFIIL